MNKSGPIIIIEDDEDDQLIFAMIFKNLSVSNALLFFSDGVAALEHLNNHPELMPFIILSDINLPKLSGIELREKIHNNEQLRLRCIPYLFFTTSAAQKDVVDAYSKSAQGFFVKPNNTEELQEMIDLILRYWTYCKSPNYIE